MLPESPLPDPPLPGSSGNPTKRPTEIGQWRVSNERVSTGMKRLDTLLDGGYYRSTVSLVSGAPGAGKSTLGGLFLEALTQRGERGLMVSFDESPDQIVRNMRSAGVDLARSRDAGTLRVLSLNSAGVAAEQVFSTIMREIVTHGPAGVVIDPISALQSFGHERFGAAIINLLVGELRARGVTSILNSLTESGAASLETPTGVSTLADVWIVLGYAERGGERNRTLSIIKALGSAHSNQVREFVMSAAGCTLADVFVAGGDVLIGTARVEYETRKRTEARMRTHAMASERDRLEARFQENEQGLERLARQLSADQQALADMQAQEAEQLAMAAEAMEALKRQRFADA